MSKFNYCVYLFTTLAFGLNAIGYFIVMLKILKYKFFWLFLVPGCCGLLKSETKIRFSFMPEFTFSNVWWFYQHTARFPCTKSNFFQGIRQFKYKTPYLKKFAIFSFNYKTWPNV